MCIIYIIIISTLGGIVLFEELKTFIAVVEHKNFTKAGEYLNLSQPSVSTAINFITEQKKFYIF